MVKLNGATPVEQVTDKPVVAAGGTLTLVAIVAVQPVGAPVAPRFTVPEKAPVGVTAIMEVPATVAKVVIDVGLADNVNPPPTVTGTFTVRDSVLGTVPVVPVTITVNPDVGNGLQLTERTIPLNDAVQPVGTVPAVNVTVPVNPLMPVTEMVEVLATPAVVSAIVDGLADNEKSWIVTLTCVVRDRVVGRVPVVPLTITLNGATLVEQVTERMAPLKDAEQPAGTEPAANMTVPVNPLIGDTVTVEVPATVARVVMAGADREKSTTWNRIGLVVCAGSVPLVPVIVTV
jgi:hypothetical protein